MNNKNEWLKGLKAGDKVIRAYVNSHSIKTVEKITKTAVELPHGERYRIDDGHQIGGGRFSMLSILEATEDRIEGVEHSELWSDIRRTFDSWDTSKVSRDKVKRIAAIINEPKETINEQ